MVQPDDIGNKESGRANGLHHGQKRMSSKENAPMEQRTEPIQQWQKLLRRPPHLNPPPIACHHGELRHLAFFRLNRHHHRQQPLLLAEPLAVSPQVGTESRDCDPRTFTKCPPPQITSPVGLYQFRSPIPLLALLAHPSTETSIASVFKMGLLCRLPPSRGIETLISLPAKLYLWLVV